jgi:hypothetical protein
MLADEEKEWNDYYADLYTSHLEDKIMKDVRDSTMN